MASTDGNVVLQLNDRFKQLAQQRNQLAQQARGGGVVQRPLIQRQPEPFEEYNGGGRGGRGRGGRGRGGQAGKVRGGGGRGGGRGGRGGRGRGHKQLTVEELDKDLEAYNYKDKDRAGESLDNDLEDYMASRAE